MARENEGSNPTPVEDVDYHSRHRQKYEMRVEREDREDIEKSDEALARSLQEGATYTAADIDGGNLPFATGSTDESEPRAPMRTGYVERLIDDDSDLRRSGRTSGVISWLSSSRASQTNDPLLPGTMDSPSMRAGSRDAFLSFMSRYWRALLAFIVIVLVILVILEA